MSKWYLSDLDILKYEKGKVTSNNLTKNGEDEIGDLNRRINHLKKEEKEIWKRIWRNMGREDE